MLHDEQTKTRLRKLGLTTPPDLVLEVARRLQNGEGLNSVSRGLVAKGTVIKIKGFLNQGELDFLLEIQPGLEAANEAIRDLGAIGLGPATPRPGIPGGLQSLEARSADLMSRLPTVEWDVEALEDCGFSKEKALDLLVERDALVGKWRERSWSAPLMQRFLELHYLVDFTRRRARKKYRAPYEYIELAAREVARGDVDQNQMRRELGFAILRYQIWRPGPFVKAFIAGVPASHRAARRVKEQILQEIQALTSMGTTVGQHQAFFMPTPLPETPETEEDETDG